MITEQDKQYLKQHRLSDEEIANVESIDIDKRTVSFKDGTEKQMVECWTRCMGYFRPVSDFNKGKQSEFAERVWFREEKVR